MRTALDTELFPKLCEVVEIPLHNQWVYLIQKNGSSSLRDQQLRDNLTVLANDQIQNLDYIDVYIRDPRSRYISGVNTYLEFLQRDHPELDYSTTFWFARRYKFLNTHYLPQFYWLANLSQYLRNDTKIRFRKLQDLKQITKFDSGPREIIKPSAEFVETLFKDDSSIELWLFLDQILLDLAGQQLTWQQVLDHYQLNYPEVIAHVLP